MLLDLRLRTQSARGRWLDAPIPRGRRSTIALLAAALTFLAHMLANPHYGFFRDELYFIICGRHPALGYVDQPPVVPLLAAFSQSAGPSLIALRTIPALFAGIATGTCALLAVEFGGGTFAVALCTVCVSCTPVLMAFGARLSPDTVEVAIWPMIALLCVRIVRGANPRWWLAIGALAGVAFLAKYNIVFFVAALIAALLFTPQRRMLASWWVGAGTLLAVLLAAPNVWWQWHYHWPMLTLLENDAGHPHLSMLYPLQQVLVTGPIFAIVWVTGLVWLLRNERLRFLGIAFVLLLVMMWALHGKDYYMGAIYPYLLAAGCIPLEHAMLGRRLAQGLTFAVLALATLASIPFIEPILPLETYVAYQSTLEQLLHANPKIYQASARTPIEYYADMTGWPQLTARVMDAYESLSPKERAKAIIFAGNFSEASAIQYYGGAAAPPVFSGNNNYFLWGPPQSAQVVVEVNAPRLLQNYRSRTLIGYIDNPYAMPYEQHTPIWILRDPIEPIAAYWPNVRDYGYRDTTY